MLKSAASVSAAAATAGLVMFLTASVPHAEVIDVATPHVETLSKGDSLLVAVAKQPCSLTGWPYYEHRCLHDNRSSAPAKQIRLIVMR